MLKKKLESSKSKPIDWEKTDLVTCVDLKYREPDDRENYNDVYHFIYASELYGTLFGIVGKFTFSEETLKVTGVDLQLLNYKGVMNMGFCYLRPSDIPASRKLEDIYFGVQGGSLRPNIYIPITDPKTGQPSEIQLERGTCKRLVFNRILYPLCGFDHEIGSFTGEKLSTPIPNSQFFDTEFKYRDGIDYYNQPVRFGMTGFEEHELITKRCVQSNVNLLYH
jgi:hypothetical protein